MAIVVQKEIVARLSFGIWQFSESIYFRSHKAMDSHPGFCKAYMRCQYCTRIEQQYLSIIWKTNHATLLVYIDLDFKKYNDKYFKYIEICNNIY